MKREHRDDRLAAVEDEFAGYTVYDEHYEKIGKVDDLFVDENDRPEYLGVKMGLLGLKSTLIPWDLCRVNERRQLIEVGAPKDRIKDAPTFDDDAEVSPDLEERVYSHFKLQRGLGERSRYGTYYRDEDYASSPASAGGVTGEERRSEDRYGERRSDDVTTTGGGERGRGEYRDRPDRDRLASPDRASATARDTSGAHGGDVTDKDELRVQRSEEELRVGTREREAGSVNVRKRVRTEREQVRVPRRREEVYVERVPVEGRERASEDEIGEDEIRVPVVEEEIVVEKRPVVKEELRIRKDVVEDEEIVEEDVRKEEVEIDEQTTGRGGRPGGTAGRDDDLTDETRRRNG
jgi:uncharacterized protein (TIGR02271 family)